MAADPYSSRPPAAAAHHPNGYQYPSTTPNPYYYNPQNNPYVYPNHHRTTLLRRLIGALIVVTVVLFTVFFICWLVIRPHRPQFHLTSLSVSNFKISNSNSSLTANWVATFQVYNPNHKLKISYDQILCSLLYKSQVLAQTRLPPFFQDTKNLTSLSASFSALASYVDHWPTSTSSPLPFDLIFTSDVSFKAGAFRPRRRLLKVFCHSVPVSGLSASSGFGNFTGPARDCKVYA